MTPLPTPTPAAIAQPPAATPENTPVPGGGRYRWSDTAPHWIEIDDTGTTVPTTPITLTAKE